MIKESVGRRSCEYLTLLFSVALVFGMLLSFALHWRIPALSGWLMSKPERSVMVVLASSALTFFALAVRGKAHRRWLSISLDLLIGLTVIITTSAASIVLCLAR